VELVILGWALVFAVVAAGVFVAARAIVQIASVVYDAIERRRDRASASREAAVLTLGAVAALAATALVAATAIILMLATVLSGNTTLPGQAQ
jgi:hypothetical protein